MRGCEEQSVPSQSASAETCRNVSSYHSTMSLPTTGDNQHIMRVDAAQRSDSQHAETMSQLGWAMVCLARILIHGPKLVRVTVKTDCSKLQSFVLVRRWVLQPPPSSGMLP